MKRECEPNEQDSMFENSNIPSSNDWKPSGNNLKRKNTFEDFSYETGSIHPNETKTFSPTLSDRTNQYSELKAQTFFHEDKTLAFDTHSVATMEWNESETFSKTLDNVKQCSKAIFDIDEEEIFDIFSEAVHEYESEAESTCPTEHSNSEILTPKLQYSFAFDEIGNATSRVKKPNHPYHRSNGTSTQINQASPAEHRPVNRSRFGRKSDIFESNGKRCKGKMRTKSPKERKSVLFGKFDHANYMKWSNDSSNFGIEASGVIQAPYSKAFESSSNIPMFFNDGSLSSNELPIFNHEYLQDSDQNELISFCNQFLKDSLP